MLGSSSGGLVGAVVAVAAFLGAFATSNYVLFLVSVASIPVCVVAGGTVGGWIAGDDGSAAFAGAVGGTVGLVVGAIASVVGYYSAGALPIADNTKHPTGLVFMVAGVVAGVAASGAAAYATPWAVSHFVE